MARILVVDDEPSLRFLLRMIFEAEGHDVDEASNGMEAAHAIEGGRVPDLLATDFMMPSMNGGELIARIRANPETRDMPVIMISASPGAERRTTSDAFFRKPFDPMALVACAAKLLEGRIDGPTLDR